MAVLLAAVALTCTPADGKAVVRDFAAAWNRGDVAAANALWATKPEFKWFSSAERTGARAYARSTVATYIRSRVRLHEKLRIVSLRAGYDAARNLVHFSGTLARGAPAKPFKGAVTCSTPTPQLVVWSM
jgi:ketosteroid isomerase-like protein